MRGGDWISVLAPWPFIIFLLVYPGYTKALMDWFISKLLQLRPFDPEPDHISFGSVLHAMFVCC